MYRNTWLARLTVAAIAVGPSISAQVADRTVAVVGDQSITASEASLQARLEAMANGVVYVDSPEIIQASLGRLIDQRLIANDIQLTGRPPVSQQQRSAALGQLKEQDFGGLDFTSALKKYNVTTEQALDFFVRQVEFTRYIDFRFRIGQTIDDEALRQLYASKYERTPNREAPEFDEVREALRAELLSATVESRLEQHIRQLRADNRVVRLGPIDRTAVAEGGGQL
jgi:hypothetical protein